MGRNTHYLEKLQPWTWTVDEQVHRLSDDVRDIVYMTRAADNPDRKNVLKDEVLGEETG